MTWTQRRQKPQWSQLSCLLCSSQKLNYSWSLQRAKSTLHFSKTTDNCSPNSFAVTLQDVVTLLLQSPQTLAKIFLHQLLHYKKHLCWLEEGCNAKGLADNYKLSLSDGHLRDLPSSGAHFFVLNSWCLFRGKQASNEPSPPSTVPNPSLFGGRLLVVAEVLITIYTWQPLLGWAQLELSCSNIITSPVSRVLLFHLPSEASLPALISVLPCILIQVWLSVPEFAT